MIIPSTCTGKCFIFRPFHPCCHRVTLRLGEFQCFNSSLRKHKYVWAYSRLANLSACVEGPKLHGAEISQHTVSRHVYYFYDHFDFVNGQLNEIHNNVCN